MSHTLCVRKDYPRPHPSPIPPHRGSLTHSVAPSPASRLIHAQRDPFPRIAAHSRTSVAPSPAQRLTHAQRGPFSRTAAHSRTAWPIPPHRGSLTHNVAHSPAQRLIHAQRGPFPRTAAHSRTTWPLKKQDAVAFNHRALLSALSALLLRRRAIIHGLHIILERCRGLTLFNRRQVASPVPIDAQLTCINIRLRGFCC